MAGDGPAVVLVKPHRLPREYPHLRLLSGAFRTIQIDPLGFGASDRPREHPRVVLHEQVLSVLDHEGVERFVVWGYSQGAAMSAAVGKASDRVAAMICGGYPLVGQPTAAWMGRMDRDLLGTAASRAFWHWYKRFDWLEELSALPCPRLLYVGGDDRTFAPAVRRTREPLVKCGVTVIEFDGLDHRSCNDEPAVSDRIVPTVMSWLERTAGSSW
jgi:pimeloyl-ACP methyl ester carboxylesterase